MDGNNGDWKIACQAFSSEKSTVKPLLINVEIAVSEMLQVTYNCVHRQNYLQSFTGYTGAILSVYSTFACKMNSVV